MEPVVPVVVMLLVCVGVPLAYAWRLLRLREASLAAWLAVAIDATLFVVLVLLLGRWDIAGAYTRIVLAAAFALALVHSFFRHRARPWREPAADARKSWPRLTSIAVLAAAVAWVLVGLRMPPEARELSFPLREGRFMVGQGGSNALLNHHASHQAQRHAADITALDAAGFRARGVLPRDPARYAIFGAAVASPCAGRVLAARDGLPDLPPPETDPENPAGNHVVIDCDGLRVELAHLREGSLRVAPGQSLAAGDLIGAVGNSGNTTEPHLHVHAVDAHGAGVPIAFDGRAPVRNLLYRR